MSDAPRENQDPRSSNSGMTPGRDDTQAKGPRLDPNTLAALIEGRLKGADRIAALTQLATSPEDQAILADAAAVNAELEPPIDIRSRRSWLDYKWVGIAAALLLAVALPMTLKDKTAAPAAGVVSLLANRGALPSGWESHSWSATRGASDGLTESARGVRVGALTSDIDIAAARKNDSVVSRAAGQIATLLVDVPGAGSVVTTYREIASGGAHSAQKLSDARLAARAMVSMTAFATGAWLEAARVAAIDHDAAFFATPATHDEMDRLYRDVDPRLQDDVALVSRSIEHLEWDTLATATNNLLTLLAGP